MSYLQVMQTQGQRLGLVGTFEPSDVTPSDLLQTISKPPRTVSPAREPSVQTRVCGGYSHSNHHRFLFFLMRLLLRNRKWVVTENFQEREDLVSNRRT